MGYIRLTEKQLKEDAEQQLKNFKKRKGFLIAIDTDGCITDNMNGKQILIFHPQFMEFYALWRIESYFREVAEFYNLFSIHRGCNRFIAIQFTLKALASRKDVRELMGAEKMELPNAGIIDLFINYTSENKLGLGNPSLEKFINQNPTEFSLYKLLGWSEAVNRTFPHISAKIPPFDNVRECLELMAQHADILVVSMTPYSDLANYWEEYGLSQYIQIIAGQEMGSKSHHIEVAKEIGGYSDDNILMLGDGNGDLKAVKSNGGLFYPITPGCEQDDWNKFPGYLEIFINGKYKGETEENLLTIFNNALPSTPPWEKPGYVHIDEYRRIQQIRKDLYNRFNPDGRLLIV